ncbi:MAG: anti-sigma factor antagonist [Acidimicrobiales bacterium]
MSSSSLSPFSGFGVTVDFAGNQVVLGVRGDVDLLSAPDLAAFLDVIIDRGHASVVLDLSDLDFMDASGLRVIAAGVRRLGSLRGELAIRSAPALVTRILEITGLAEVVRFEQPEPAGDHLGPEQSGRIPGVPVKVGAANLAQHLRQVTAVPADEDVVDGALRLVVALAKATVTGADGVSVSLHRHGRLSTVAASDQTILDMDADQYATGEGPCVDASIEGRWFHAESLDDEARWPAFTPRAQKLGINAILSSPLLVRDQPVGALNIYSRTAGAFAAQQQELASIFATEASVILTAAGAAVTDAQLAGRLDDALRARQIIAQAQGVIMERDGVDPDAAYGVLRRFSQQTGRPLRDRAADVISSIGQSPTGRPVKR